MEFKLSQLKRIASLPANIRTNIAALRKLHLDMVDYEQRKNELELDFQRLYEDSCEKRRQIVAGSYVPKVDDLPVAYPGIVNHSVAEQPGGVPEFWLTVFRMSEHLSELVGKGDEEALRKLVDVRVVDLGQPLTGFELEFEFAPNEFFADSVLKKHYLTNGTEIYEAIGQEIQWKEGGDLAGQSADSFFHFFNPKRFEKSDPERHEFLMKKDFEIGRCLEQEVVPRATAIYLGRNDDEQDEISDMLEDEAFCGVYSLNEEAEAILMNCELEE
uniref:Putative nucleosome assembly protein nap-1 n=1 Tax=Culex tarsalis TaxID=7177 RepID=A0A1Q3FTK6_CULTA